MEPNKALGSRSFKWLADTFSSAPVFVLPPTQGHRRPEMGGVRQQQAAIRSTCLQTVSRVVVFIFVLLRFFDFLYTLSHTFEKREGGGVHAKYEMVVTPGLKFPKGALSPNGQVCARQRQCDPILPFFFCTIQILSIQSQTFFIDFSLDILTVSEFCINQIKQPTWRIKVGPFVCLCVILWCTLSGQWHVWVEFCRTF